MEYLPSNEGRGYVLRRILRRAVRHGRLIGISDKFLAGAVDVVISMFGHGIYQPFRKTRLYPKGYRHGGNFFLRTLKQGSELLNEEIAKLKAEGKTVLDGATAFKLNDTFGFPWKLTAEILEEQGLTMDKEGFDAALEVQRQWRTETLVTTRPGRPVVYETKGVDVAALKVDESETKGTIVQMYPAHDAQAIEVLLRMAARLLLSATLLLSTQRAAASWVTSVLLLLLPALSA